MSGMHLLEDLDRETNLVKILQFEGYFGILIMWGIRLIQLYNFRDQFGYLLSFEVSFLSESLKYSLKL
jgi:hypothetical protein